MKRFARVWPVAAVAVVASAGWLQAASAADAAVVPVVKWSPHAVYKGRQINMGPTGARGWVDGSTIVVAHIYNGSPACGVLRVGDTLVGAGGKDFQAGSDPRVALGNAITEAETKAGAGKLELGILRDGKRQDVVVPITVMGSYGANWPYDCEKSARILDEACAYLAGAQFPDGQIPSELGMATQWAGLLFLASGEAKYLDNARRAAYWVSARTWEKEGLNCWPSGYSGLLLAEYYLATGDRSVLPTLQKLSTFLAGAQMACGSWGHNGPWGGYGAVNQVGLACLLAMVLSKECGLDVDMAAMKHSLDFFERYADKGWIPYGDHRPFMGVSGNGKSALAAVAFDVTGGYDKVAREFASCVAGSYAHREDGHTGPYFSFMWGPLAARRGDDAAFRQFLDHQRWYYDLARTWEGGLVCQPNDENLSGRTPGGYTWEGPSYTTGGMALFYALPRKTLRILGAPRGPFTAGPNGPFAGGVSASIKEFRDHWTHRERKAFDDGLAVMLKNSKLSGDQRKLVNALAAVAARQSQSVKLTLAGLASDFKEGDAYRAAEKLKSLERLVGADAPELADAQKLIASDTKWIDTGRKYYQAWSEMKMMAGEYWHYYGQRAMEAMDGVEPIIPPAWTPLVNSSEHVAQSWKTMRGDIDKGMARWVATAHDDSKWADENAPVASSGGILLMRKAFTLSSTDFGRLRLRLLGGKGLRAKVYMNGSLVAETVNGDAKNYSQIDLPKEALGLLKRGGNVLAVSVETAGGAKIDVSLEAAARR